MEKTLPPFPEFLNEEAKLIKWHLSEIYSFVGPIIIVWIFYSNLLGFFTYLIAPMLGAITLSVYKILTKGTYGDLLSGMFYWLLPSKWFYKSLPESFVREYIL